MKDKVLMRLAWSSWWLPVMPSEPQTTKGTQSSIVEDGEEEMG